MGAKRLNTISQEILGVKQKLFNRIAKHFGVDVPVKLVRPEAVFLGAQGSFEGDVIKISEELPLFWQLVVLEHEMGHYLSFGEGGRAGIIYKAFRLHHLSTEEKRAWDWVEENPIVRGGVIDQEVRAYIGELKIIAKMYGHLDEVMRIGWWY